MIHSVKQSVLIFDMRGVVLTKLTQIHTRSVQH
jgi:hypothetical protein